MSEATFIIVLVLFVLGALDLALSLLIWMELKKGGGQNQKQALDLAHEVARDAMIHLSSKTPLQATEATATLGRMKLEDEIAAQEKKFLLEREIKKMEEQDKRRAEFQKNPVVLKDVDGNVHNLADFDPM